MLTLQDVIFGLIALGLLVFVHELGHFTVAKLSGIRVLKFSLGFGSRLFGFKRGDTEYLISALPLGGYVKMAGEQPEAGRPIQPGDYFSRPWWVRLLVLMAGPAMNLLAPILVLGTLFWAGFTVPLARPLILTVAPGSAAAQAGLRPGDVITGLNGQAVDDWEGFSDRINRFGTQQPGRPLELAILRAGRPGQVSVELQLDKVTRRFIMGVSLVPAATNIIERVWVGSPAEMAGFRAGDRLLSVEDRPVWTQYDFQQLVKDRTGIPTRVRIQRGQEQQELMVTPTSQQVPEQGKIGVECKTSDQERLIRYSFLQAYVLGANRTWDMSRAILGSLGQMLTGKISAKESLGGPISIVRMAGQEARAGLQDFFFFLSGISIMLAVLNLLPIPILDGGNAVFFIWEGVFRRPLSAVWQQRLQMIGLALLLALMVYATYNDIYKLLASVLRLKP